MDKYELAVLYHPDLEIDLDKAEKQVEKLVKDAGGSIKETDNWGKRKLAYKIAGHDYAVYVFYTLELPGSGVSQLNNALNITGEVIRFLITKPDEKAIAKAEAMKVNRDKRLSKMSPEEAEADSEESDDEDE
ncbi:30S ribosomal protein S6 [Candidatus Saccharibacteria bacterium]|nr:30S ribosomal protein S6 [Candidatus Saccharibacteria bacterium]